MVASRLLVSVAVMAILLGAACAQQSSETNDRLREYLERFPGADANRDGVLTREEALAHRERRQRMLEQREAYEAGKPAPDLADVAYGPHERNRLDLWQADGEGPRPLVVFIHGGGWVGGDKSRIARDTLEALLGAGISVAAINYRYSTQAPYPAPMSDAARALQFLRLHAADFGIDPSRIGAFGGSAGACTSMWLAFRDDMADPASDDPLLRQSTRLSCIAPIAGPTTLDPQLSEEWLGAPITLHPASVTFFGVDDVAQLDDPAMQSVIDDASPITHVSADDPPTYMVYSLPDVRLGEDATPGEVAHHPRYGIHLKDRMDRLGVECVLIYPDSPGEDRYGGVVEFFAAKLLADRADEDT